jgi:rhodanese-related sulfurtransferase
MNKVLFIWLMILSSSPGQSEKSFDNYLQELRAKFKDVPQFYDDSSDLKNVRFLDAREKEEFEISHIRNAEWIGSDNLDKRHLDSIGHDIKIVVYCSVGYRSSLVVRQIRSAGFLNTYNLFGGIFKWANDGRELGKVVQLLTGFTDTTVSGHSI